MNLPVDELVFTNRHLRLFLKAFQASYEGVVAADGKTVTGKWRQGGGELPLALMRVEQLPRLKRPQNPVKPYPYQEEEVRYQNTNAGIVLAGTLTVPKGQGRSPRSSCSRVRARKTGMRSCFSTSHFSFCPTI